MRRAIIGESAIGQNRRSDLGPWDLLDHAIDTAFTLVPPPNHNMLPQGETIGEVDDLDHLQTETVLALPLGGTPSPKSRSRVSKPLKMSRRGILCPSLPIGVIKSLSSTFARSVGLKKTNISKESLEAIVNASDWFFEQLGEDLGTYAEHAGRRKVDGRDISTVMKR